MRVPFTHLFVRKSMSVAITAGGHIYVFETSTGRTLSSTAELPDIKLGPVISAAVCGENDEHLVTVTDDKTMRVWRTGDLSVVNERIVEKKPTCLQVTKDGRSILISDKFGDVYSFTIDLPGETSVASSDGTDSIKRTQQNTLESLGGKLLLGHVSLLTTFLLSPDEKFIITADRDEHIRVSWHPESYVIESFCLGQKKFVSALLIPLWDSSKLLSGGGDPYIKLWDWMQSKPLAEFDIQGAVLPFVKITRNRSGGGDGSDNEGDGNENSEKYSTKAQRRKLRKKGKKAEEDPTAGKTTLQEEAMDIDENESEVKPETGSSSVVIPVESKPNEPVLAISKIDTIETQSRKLCVFSAIGATALFYFILPTETVSPEVTIQHVDLGRPVLDFCLLREAGEVWVLTDADCSEDGLTTTEPNSLIRVLILDGLDLKESKESNAHPNLLNSLNSCEAAKSPRDSVDLYSLLTTLPKHTDGSANADDQQSAEVVQETSKKEQGRMKARRAREAVALKRASEVVGDASSSPAGERDVKKLKNGSS